MKRSLLFVSTLIILTGIVANAAAARARLAGRVAQKYLADKKATRSIPPGGWQTFARHLAKDLTPDVRAQWVAKLRAAYIDGPDGLARVSIATLVPVAGALNSLGDKQAAVLPATLVQTTTAWQSWQPDELAHLASRLASLGKSGATARRRLADCLAQKYLADAKAARSISPGGWQTFARHLAMDLAPDVRRQWAATLKAAFAPTSQKHRDIKVLAAALQSLGDKEAGVYVAKWMMSK